MIWFFLQTLAGLLMSTAHPIRVSEFVWEPGILNFILASLGLALFIKVSSHRRKKLTRFLLGLWGGLVYFSASLYWIVHALHEFGNLHFALAFLAAFLLWIYCALYMGLWSFLAGFKQVLHRGLFQRIILWASLWAGLGALREWLLTGFGWAEIGYFFAAWPWVGQSASIWGVHGLSFLWVVFVCLLIHGDEWWPSKRGRLQVGLGSLVVLLVLFGAQALQNRAYHDAPKARVALIQPNIEQSIKWSAVAAKDHLQTLIDLTTESLVSEPELVVWPETSYPFSLSAQQRQLPISSSTPLIIGAVIAERSLIRNSALLVQGDQILQRYDKTHLVPFGEFVPFEKWIPFGKLVENVGRFIRGDLDQGPLELERIKAGILICYEDIFSRHPVRHAKNGANILVNLTNDAWYGKSSALRQHENIARIHAWAVGLPMVRATNNGQTAILYANKREIIETHEAGYLIGEVPILEEPSLSPFARFHPFMDWIWWLVFAIGFGWRMRAQNKKIFFPGSVS